MSGRAQSLRAANGTDPAARPCAANGAAPGCGTVLSGRADSHKQSGKTFPAASNGFQPFPPAFTCSLDLFEPAFGWCSGAVCGHLCGQKRFPPQTGDFSPARDGKRFTFQVSWIVTLTKELFKCFLCRTQRKVCGAIDKEIGADMAVRFMKTQLPKRQAPDQIRR